MPGGIPLFTIPGMYEWDYFTVIVTGAGEPLSANAGGGSLSHYEVSVGQPITLYGSAYGGTPPYTYQWTLGDGRIVDGQNPTVIYNIEDREIPPETEFTVTLTVVDGNYDVATDTAVVTVLGPEDLTVSISAPADAGTEENVIFTSTVNGGTAPYTYAWTFGDGANSNLQNPTHVYNNAGTYTITLTVTDADGKEKEATHTITIEGESAGEDPQIISVTGLLRIKATIAAGDNDCDWTISTQGNFVLSGGEASGTIPANTEQTVRLPLTLAFGKVTITVTANTIMKQYTAFALGPLFLGVKEA
jgi:PKD repeat protein